MNALPDGAPWNGPGNVVCPCCGQPMRATDMAAYVSALPVGGKRSRRLLACLARRFGRYVHTEVLIASMYGDEPSGGPLNAGNTVSVLVYHLRPKLAPYGLTIEGRMGSDRGRRLTWSRQ